MRKKERISKGNEAVIYTRVSTLKQTLNGSLSTQEKKCRDYCEKEGYEVVKLFPEDKGGTGTDADRQSFQEVLDYCRKNKNVGHMIVFRFNRFFRFTKGHLVMYDELLEKYGTRVETATENCNTDSAADIRARNSLAVAAEYESNDLSEKAKDGMKEARLEGRLTNTPPMGLKREQIPHGKSRVIHDPEYASYIKQIFLMFDDGKLLEEILETVNTNGFRTPSGNKLNRKQLLRILRNIKYAGYVPVDENTEPVPAAFKAIVDYTLFERVQRRLAGDISRSHTSYKVDRPLFPLRRYVKCIFCGAPLTGSISTNNRGKKYAYYHCRTTGCKGKGIEPSELHRIFLGVVSLYRTSPELVCFLKDSIHDCYESDIGRRKKRIEASDRQKDVYEKRRQKLIDSLLDGKINQDLYDEQIQILENNLQSTIEDIESLEMSLNDQLEDIDVYIGLFKDLAGLWSEAPLALKQALQEAVFPEMPMWDSRQGKFYLGVHSSGLELD